MEPQWNPMIEEQALDRIHRIGQKKPVTTIRYIVKDSFEEVISQHLQTGSIDQFLEYQKHASKEEALGRPFNVAIPSFRGGFIPERA